MCTLNVFVIEKKNVRWRKLFCYTHRTIVCTRTWTIQIADHFVIKTNSNRISFQIWKRRFQITFLFQLNWIANIHFLDRTNFNMTYLEDYFLSRRDHRELLKRSIFQIESKLYFQKSTWTDFHSQNWKNIFQWASYVRTEIICSFCNVFVFSAQ